MLVLKDEDGDDDDDDEEEVHALSNLFVLNLSAVL